MNEWTQGYLIGVASIWIGVAVICACYFLAGFVERLWKIWNDRNKPVGNRIVGHIESIVETDDGLIATGRLDDDETVRLIKDAKIHHISIGYEGFPITVKDRGGARDDGR